MRREAPEEIFLCLLPNAVPNLFLNSPALTLSVSPSSSKRVSNRTGTVKLLYVDPCSITLENNFASCSIIVEHFGAVRRRDEDEGHNYSLTPMPFDFGTGRPSSAVFRPRRKTRTPLLKRGLAGAGAPWPVPCALPRWSILRACARPGTSRAMRSIEMWLICMLLFRKGRPVKMPLLEHCRGLFCFFLGNLGASLRRPAR